MVRDSYMLKDVITRAVQNFLIRIVNDETQGEVSFLQIGANDGMMSDPLCEAIRHNRWRGLMVEPVPALFEALKANYAGYPGLEFAQVACADAPGRLPFYQVRNLDDMTWDGMRGLSSFSRDLIRAHFASDEAFATFVEEVSVDVVTAGSLTETSALDRLDLVLIDTEGADYRVLRGLDLARYRPKLVMIEHLHLDTDDRNAMYGRFVGLGYRRFVGVMDSFFYLPELLGLEELQALAVFEAPPMSLR
jgi:FkbM family methyltransferase